MKYFPAGLKDEIKIKDKYIFYVVSKEAEKIKELFKDSIKS